MGVCSGAPLPERPSRQQGTKSFRFDGVLADQHTTEDGSQYLHLTFNRGNESGAVIDAEFLLLTGIHFRRNLALQQLLCSACSRTHHASDLGRSVLHKHPQQRMTQQPASICAWPVQTAAREGIDQTVSKVPCDFLWGRIGRLKCLGAHR